MPRMPWKAAALMAIGGLCGATPASAAGGLSLSISSPRIEGTPLTFTASGVADGAVSDGESSDYVIGAVLRPNRPCPPGGADDFGDIPGTVVPTVRAFPIGPFDVSARVGPATSSTDLLAGPWRECVYLQDRGSNAVIAEAQQDFTTRRARVGVRILGVPRHLSFVYDTLGRPTSTATFVVRARSEVTLRTVQMGIELPGRKLPCTGDMHTARAGISDPHRVKTGPARTYRLRTSVVFPAGPPPYGKRVRVCAVVAYSNPSTSGQFLEGAAMTTMVVAR